MTNFADKLILFIIKNLIKKRYCELLIFFVCF